MRVGVGLPNTVRGVGGPTIVEWARRADAGPFSSLGVIDRVAYPSLEPLLALAAAAAVTERVRLLTSVVIAPLRPAALLAKQAATIDVISGGRLTLGVGVGPRPDDYEVCGEDWKRRGRTMERHLDTFERIWAGEPLAEGSVPVGPRPGRGRVEVLLGGSSDKAVGRLARWGDGYIGGSGPAKVFARWAGVAREAWERGGRSGTPRLVAQNYFASSEDPDDEAAANVKDYYAWLGPFADRIAGAMWRGDEGVQRAVAEFSDAGCEELVFFPAVTRPGELDWLAERVS